LIKARVIGKMNSKASVTRKQHAFDAPLPVMADAAGKCPSAVPGVSKVF
jgi:hypothetical protein